MAGCDIKGSADGKTVYAFWHDSATRNLLVASGSGSPLVFNPPTIITTTIGGEGAVQLHPLRIPSAGRKWSGHIYSSVFATIDSAGYICAVWTDLSGG